MSDHPTATTLVTRTTRLNPADVYAAVLTGRNANTTRSYRIAFDDFARAMDAQDARHALTLLLALGRGDAAAAAAAYRAHMAGRGLKPATINQRLSALRAFVTEAHRFQLVDWTLDVKNVRARTYRDTAGPGYEAYRAMLATVIERVGGSTDAKGVRDLAIMRLLHDVGLRRKEVVGLDLSDLDVGRAWGDGQAGGVWIVGKGMNGERSFVGLPRVVLDAVLRWVAVRGGDPGPLFRNLDRRPQNEAKGRRLSGQSVWRDVKRYARDAGVTTAVSPHRLRHGGATRVAQVTNGNVTALQAWGRWSSLETAQIYVDNDRDLGARTAALIAE